MSLFKAIYEHLKTRKKYNTLQLKLNIAKEDNERLLVQLNTEKRIYLKRQAIWEKALKEQEEQIIELKKRGVKSVSKSKGTSKTVSRKKQDNK